MTEADNSYHSLTASPSLLAQPVTSSGQAIDKGRSDIFRYVSSIASQLNGFREYSIMMINVASLRLVLALDQ